MGGQTRSSLPARGQARRPRRPFWVDGEAEDGGFSTAGMVIALLVALSLVFSGVQVYRVQTSSAEIQEVADAAALAAGNVVADYYLVARLCDAVVLSLTLTGIIAMGVGIAALCAPPSAAVGARLVKAAKQVLEMRDRFAEKAAAGLDRLQKTLPYLAAVNASRVISANRGVYGSDYFGFAIALPFEGEPVSAGAAGAADALEQAVDDEADALEQAGRRAEDAAKEARKAKERAYEADCGAAPDYCMYERARSLADLEGASNPFFGNVDTWGFSVALDRARAYYARRLALEEPQAPSVDEQANSALRKRFYRYAVQTLEDGWVRESQDSFSANFPLLPKNTAEMRETSLYTEAAYPITVDDSGQREMHAWEGCPRADGSIGKGSIADMEAGGYALCPSCRFSASSLGKVAAATTSIENGFEYHYRIVAEAADAYQKARESFAPESRKARSIAESLFDEVMNALREMAGHRLSVAPPGRLGVVSFVVSGESLPTDGALSAFVHWSGSLGARVAISGAALVSDSPEQGRTVIASALDGLSQRDGYAAIGAVDAVMDIWSAVLFAYTDGQARIGEGIDKVAGKVPFRSDSRLGIWSSERFAELMESFGLQPAELDAPKPVLVNTGQVAGADSSAFSVRLLSVKRAASGLTGDNLLEGVIDGMEEGALQGVSQLEGPFVIAELEIAGEGSPTIPLTVTLPAAARDGAAGRISAIADGLRSIAGEITGTRQWR